jgi:ATP-dependent RNA helicase RhlE
VTDSTASTVAPSFSSLGLHEPLQRAVRDAGYETPTPIQERAIPPLLAGRDLLGCAKTGTGKTAAFALPILQRLSTQKGIHSGPGAHPRALVLVPTRELAGQVTDSFVNYGRHLRLGVVSIYGGISQGPQVRALKRGVEVIVATPGRLVDLIGQGHARLERIEYLVLDEADHMLDLGFLPDVKRILSRLPTRRQTMLFSATMPPPIAALAREILRDPEQVSIAPPGSTVEAIEQRVHFVERDDKMAVLAALLRTPEVERALVFTRTKHGADRVARRLARNGLPAFALHGDKSQGARERTLADFRSGKVRVMVATDIAARGIDVQGISHVVNFELPNIPETYVHRIGRTARAGARGIAVSLCSREERAFLRDIEKMQRRNVPVVATGDVPELPDLPPPTRDYPQPDHGPRVPRANHSSHGSHGPRAPYGGPRERNFHPRERSHEPAHAGRGSPIGHAGHGGSGGHGGGGGHAGKSGPGGPGGSGGHGGQSSHGGHGGGQGGHGGSGGHGGGQGGHGGQRSPQRGRWQQRRRR